MSEKKVVQMKQAECLSMTGYAQARKEQDGWALRVSVKSVNHRFLDLKLRMPEGFDFYELRLRQMVRERIHRGHLDVHVNIEPGTAAPVQVNKEIAKAYLRAAEVLRQETSAAASVDVVSLLRLPGVIAGISGTVPETEEDQERLAQALEGCLREALARLDDMRRAEGKHLVEELRERLARIAGLTEEVRGLVVTLRPAFARRLEMRLKELPPRPSRKVLTTGMPAQTEASKLSATLCFSASPASSSSDRSASRRRAWPAINPTATPNKIFIAKRLPPFLAM